MATKHMNEYCLQGHKLELMKVPAVGSNSFTCNGCNERGFGPRYSCCETTTCCNFNLHKECYQPSLTMQHPNFPGHTFDFLPKLPPTIYSPRFCDACGKQVKGYVYHCKETGCGWDFHPCCNNLPPSIQFTGDGSELYLPEAQIAADHDHVLQVVGSKKVKVCFRCKKNTLSGTNKTGVPGWFYVSTCGGYRCHVYCMMEKLREIQRARETAARLATAPISSGRRNVGNNRSSGHRDQESWWEPLSFASTMTGFILGDPTAIVTTAFFELFNG